MSLSGIGVDIENVSRFRELPFDQNKELYSKIFTKNEMKYCLNKPDPYQHFTARFCAKEALIKAMDGKISVHQLIEVVKNGEKPFIQYKRNRYLLSMSHTKDTAIAFVIVEN